MSAAPKKEPKPRKPRVLKPKVPKPKAPVYDDAKNDYIITLGEAWDDDRYLVKGLLGKGSFGQVVRAFDSVMNQDVAIKIVKNKPNFHRQAQIEIALLRSLADRDTTGQSNTVTFFRTFMFRNHICIVFELLGCNLYDVIKQTQHRGLPLSRIREYGAQLFNTLKFLRTPEVNIIHCDLKPENILLCAPDSSRIKVIDFGSSCHVGQTIYQYIQSRFYRSPEVLLGLPYSTEIDMWSAGCILVELYTGRPLFNGADEVDQMNKFCEVLGQPSASMLARAPPAKVAKYFSRAGLQFTLLPTVKKYSSMASRTIASILDGVAVQRRAAGIPDHLNEEHAQFVELVSRLLQFEPFRRLTPTEALRHSFFSFGPVSLLFVSHRRSISTNSAAPPVDSVRFTSVFPPGTMFGMPAMASVGPAHPIPVVLPVLPVLPLPTVVVAAPALMTVAPVVTPHAVTQSSTLPAHLPAVSVASTSVPALPLHLTMPPPPLSMTSPLAPIQPQAATSQPAPSPSQQERPPFDPAILAQLALIPAAMQLLMSTLRENQEMHRKQEANLVRMAGMMQRQAEALAQLENLDDLDDAALRNERTHDDVRDTPSEMLATPTHKASVPPASLPHAVDTINKSHSNSKSARKASSTPTDRNPSPELFLPKRSRASLSQGPLSPVAGHPTGTSSEAREPLPSSSSEATQSAAPVRPSDSISLQACLLQPSPSFLQPAPGSEQ